MLAGLGGSCFAGAERAGASEGRGRAEKGKQEKNVSVSRSRVPLLMACNRKLKRARLRRCSMVSRSVFGRGSEAAHGQEEEE